MKTYNALSKSFTDEVKTIMGGGKSIDDAFIEVKLDIIDNNFGDPTPTPIPDSTPTPAPESTPTPKPEIDVNELTQGDGQQDGYYYVDLGLSVKWATCNVGATKPEDEGLLFQFGRVDGYRYRDKNSQFRTNAQNKQDTGNEFIPKTESGNTYDKGATLQPADDAASVNMGGRWRMPTYDELKELVDNTTHNAIIVNRVKGMMFTSTKPGYEDKQLFIPFMQGTWCDGIWDKLNRSLAYVRSSQVNPSNVNNVYILICYSRGSININNDHSRYRAYSVRGVFKTQE